MASLRSITRDGRFNVYAFGPADLEDARTICAHSLVELRNRDTIPVNAQQVYESVRHAVDAGEVFPGLGPFQQIPRPEPPYRRMWIESLQDFEDGRKR